MAAVLRRPRAGAWGRDRFLLVCFSGFFSFFFLLFLFAFWNSQSFRLRRAADHREAKVAWVFWIWLLGTLRRIGVLVSAHLHRQELAPLKSGVYYKPHLAGSDLRYVLVIHFLLLFCCMEAKLGMGEAPRC